MNSKTDTRLLVGYVLQQEGRLRTALGAVRSLPELKRRIRVDFENEWANSLSGKTAGLGGDWAFQVDLSDREVYGGADLFRQAWGGLVHARVEMEKGDASWFIYGVTFGEEWQGDNDTQARLRRSLDGSFNTAGKAPTGGWAWWQDISAPDTSWDKDEVWITMKFRPNRMIDVMNDYLAKAALQVNAILAP